MSLENPKCLPVGTKWKPSYALESRSQLRHVRAVVDERMICRWWSKCGQSWQYEIVDSYYLELLASQGKLVVNGRQCYTIDSIKDN